MAANKDDEIPPIPVPPTGASTVPPVEPPPAAPTPPATPEAPTPPAEPAPLTPPAAPDPYASPAVASATPPAPGYSPPPVYGQPGSAGPAYAPQPAGPAQGLSITSMILGIGGLLLSFVGWGFLPALAAVITGHIAQKRQPYAKPFWLTGIITGYVGVAIGLAIVAIAILFFLLAIGSAAYIN